jgi:hypothetical protein
MAGIRNSRRELIASTDRILKALETAPFSLPIDWLKKLDLRDFANVSI